MLALVAARREELRGVLRPSAWRQRRAPEDVLAYQRRDHAVSALLTGAGRERTERAMTWLLETQKPDSILSVGFAGACAENLDVGDLVLATRLHFLDGEPFDWEPNLLDRANGGQDEPVVTAADPEMLERARAAVEMIGIDCIPGDTVSVRPLVRTPGLASWLGETYGVSAVDRESYWVAAAAAAAGVPCLSVRAIAYTASETLPAFAAELPDTPVGGRLGPVFRYGIRHPRLIRRHLSALRTARTAITTFAAALTGSEMIPDAPPD